jgi:hypothetical protein
VEGHIYASRESRTENPVEYFFGHTVSKTASKTE